MGRAKDIIVKVIPSKVANEFVKKHHYSGKVVPNSTHAMLFIAKESEALIDAIMPEQYAQQVDAFKGGQMEVRQTCSRAASATTNKSAAIPQGQR
jgi:hypothetical protein